MLIKAGDGEFDPDPRAGVAKPGLDCRHLPVEDVHDQRFSLGSFPCIQQMPNQFHRHGQVIRRIAGQFHRLAMVLGRKIVLASEAGEPRQLPVVGIVVVAVGNQFLHGGDAALIRLEVPVALHVDHGRAIHRIAEDPPAQRPRTARHLAREPQQQRHLVGIEGHCRIKTFIRLAEAVRKLRIGECQGWPGLQHVHVPISCLPFGPCAGGVLRKADDDRVVPLCRCDGVIKLGDVGTVAVHQAPTDISAGLPDGLLHIALGLLVAEQFGMLGVRAGIDVGEKILSDQVEVRCIGQQLRGFGKEFLGRGTGTIRDRTEEPEIHGQPSNVSMEVGNHDVRRNGIRSHISADRGHRCPPASMVGMEAISHRPGRQLVLVGKQVCGHNPASVGGRIGVRR